MMRRDAGCTRAAARRTALAGLSGHDTRCTACATDLASKVLSVERQVLEVVGSESQVRREAGHDEWAG